MSLVDVVVAVLALAAAVRGWRRGLLGQAFELGGGLLGLLAGIALGPRIASAVTDSAGLQGALIALVTVVVGLSFGQVLGFMLGHRFGSLARRARLGGVDSAFGVVFGIGVTLLAFWLVGSLLVHGPSRELARALRGSRVLAAMNDVARPPDVLAHVTQYLNTSRFPEVFGPGVTPSAGAPVDLPSRGITRRAFDAAGVSTVRVETRACGGLQLGSGWVAGANTVVTNAHVVAGGDAVTVEDRGGRHPGTVVLFDPGVDIAVVKAEGLAGRPLALAPRPLAPPQPGATLGYPGAEGGRLEVQRAAVQKRLQADGLDIYGTRSVLREIYVLRARVRQGDSGGPFVLPDGRVGGVVFAASTTDPRVGYALTGAEIAGEVRDGARADAPVDTGGCTH
jgi:S1-C subfamily serine protease